ncbi:hypothetical protein D9M70_587760 [compost metagenome]
MGIHRLGTQVEDEGDFLVALAPGQPVEHLLLAPGELLDRRLDRGPGQRVDDLAGDARTEVTMPADHRLDRQLQLDHRGVLEQIAGGAHLHGLDHVVAGVMHGQQDDRQVRPARADDGQGLEPRAATHGEIQQQHIR